MSVGGQIGTTCPCGTGDSLDRCCGPFLSMQAEPRTAAALMRARYSAHALGNTAYLVRSWHPDTCPPVVTDSSYHWTGLEVRDRERGRALDRDGTVCFVAHWEREGERGQLAERSRFVRLGTRWVYVDGDALPG